ncbi:IS3 family transposase [Nocardia mexicana]|uniref:Helix-turn-helix protein n=1 Tax=Nocardia mexicana TaxID=279262 RepID=A0A370GNM2_9NOCA|nr:IS3 family transposase [Nocardia mexicana]RDI45328.1 helix-turn-helix protein [Nocardia mexicana]
MRFVKDHPQHSVELVLRVLGIASSTFYGWLQQAKNPSRRLADEQLLAEIVDIHTSSGGTYGSPRVHAMLRRRGIAVGRKRVERLMRAAGLQGAFLRKKWRIPSTRQDRRAAPAPDLVNRDFTADTPDRLWVADATRIPTGEGVVWLAARCAMRSPTGSWAGNARTAVTPNWCSGRASMRCGCGMWVTGCWSTIPIVARPVNSTGRRNISWMRSCDGCTEAAGL